MSQRQYSRHSHLGWGRSPCSVPGQQEEVQLPASGAGPDQTAPLLIISSQILPVQPPSAGSSGMQQCSGAAWPSPTGGCWGPALTTKALQTEEPHCPGAGLPDEHCPPRICLAFQDPAAAFPGPRRCMAEGLAQRK